MTDEISAQLREAMISSHPLLRCLQEIGNVKKFSGGRTIVTELEFPILVEPKTGSSRWYSGYETINPEQWVPANDLHKTQPYSDRGDDETRFSAAEYAIHQVGAFGEGEKVIKSVSDLFRSTIAIGGGRNSINSLPKLVSTSPTFGLVGGIDRQHHRFWRNLAVRCDWSNIVGAVELMIERLSITTNLGKPPRRPDLVLVGEDDFGPFRGLGPATEYDEWGFKSVDLDGTAVVLDPGIRPVVDNYVVVPSRIYVLHTRYFALRFHESRDWCALDVDRFITPETKPIGKMHGWAGNLILSCSYAQGVLSRLT
jgi:hypothetical protein